MLVLGWVVFFKNKSTVGGWGWGWEIALLRTSEKSAKWKMMLTDFKPTFRPILELFSVTLGRFSLEGGLSRRLSNPLSIYDQAPYFPEGGGPIFPHGPIFNSRSPAPGGRYVKRPLCRHKTNC